MMMLDFEHMTVTNETMTFMKEMLPNSMASNPLFIIPDFFFHFPNELCYGYLRFEEIQKIPLGR
jgi:hypothetical protein